MSGTLTQAIRNFAKGLEAALTSAMAGCPQEMIDIKVNIVQTDTRVKIPKRKVQYPYLLAFINTAVNRIVLLTTYNTF